MESIYQHNVTCTIAAEAQADSNSKKQVSGSRGDEANDEYHTNVWYLGIGRQCIYHLCLHASFGDAPASSKSWRQLWNLVMTTSIFITLQLAVRDSFRYCDCLNMHKKARCVGDKMLYLAIVCESLSANPYSAQ